MHKSFSHQEKQLNENNEFFKTKLKGYHKKVFKFHVGCPGFGLDWVNFCSGREGHGQDPEVIQYHLMSFLGVGERDSLLRRRGSG